MTKERGSYNWEELAEKLKAKHEELNYSPEEVEEIFEFLEDLRRSGVTNMFGATPYLSEHFGWDDKTAKRVLVFWMENYNG